MVDNKRGKSSQSKHDKEVKSIANDYKQKGYEVEADIPGYSKPPSVGRYIPDIRARKGGQETIVEVETTDSVDSERDIKQQDAFHRWARGEKHHFKRKIV